MNAQTTAWDRALHALSLFANNRRQLRGITVRARSGPVRDAFLQSLPFPTRKIHPSMSREALLGGVDFAKTLETGRLVRTKGLLEQTGMLVLTMAERCPPDTAALLAAALDRNPDLSLMLLDEGADDDERAPPVLTQRLAFQISLEGIGRLQAKPSKIRFDTASVQKPFSKHHINNVITRLTVLAARLGIDTLRLPNLAVNAAKTNALIHGRPEITDEDIQVAAELILAPRATRLPEPPEASPQQPDRKPRENSKSAPVPDEMLVEAVRAVVPPDLLENARNSDKTGGKGSGAGQRRKGNRRGRPLPARPGRLDGTSRLDLVATLRTAAPWQSVRGRKPGAPLRVLPSDIHLKRFEDLSDRLIIFAVDASGSAALARLSEAKGAIELLLARAYAARDHVALIAFRGDTAELLLPPTRSLVQTKRRLAQLPGGGGTPLAKGLQISADLAQSSQSKGLAPTIVLLTDGRTNIALDGKADRAQAVDDATSMARWIRSMGISTAVVDVAARPQKPLSILAQVMGGTYLPLPRANAERMSEALAATMDHGLGT